MLFIQLKKSDESYFLLTKLQTLNFDLTKAYLDLVSIYVSLMILLSRVEDRKAVLGLFNAAHELTHNHRYLFF